MLFRMESGLGEGIRESWAVFASHQASFSPEILAVHWARAATGFLLFLAIQCSFLGLGHVASRFIAGKRDCGGDPMIVWPLGLGFSALVMAGLSLVGGVFPAVIIALLMASFPAGIRYLFRSRWPAEWSANRAGVARKGLYVLVALVICLTLAGILAPEAEGDVLCIHYGIPLQIMKLHKSVEMPFTLYDDYPALWEMIVLPFLCLGGETPARFLGLFLDLFLAWQVFRLARRFVPGEWALAPAILTLTNPFVWMSASVAKNDLLVAVLGMAALMPLFGNAGKPGVLPVFIAGMMSGFMFATKYNGGFLLPAIAAVLWISRSFNRRTVSALFAGFMPVVLPLLAKNMINTGDPLIPFCSMLFDTPYSTAISRERFIEFAGFTTLQDPSAMTVWVKVRGALGAFPASEESFVRWFMLVPSVMMVGAMGPRFRALAAAILVSGIAWFAVPSPVRYGIFLFPLCFVLCAPGLKAMGRVGATMAFLAVGFQVVHMAVSPRYAGMVKAGLGLESREAFIARRLATFNDAVIKTNEIAGFSARILGVGVNRVASFNGRLDYGAFSGWVFPPFRIVHESADEKDVSRKFRQYHWDYVLYNSMTAAFWNRTYADDAWTEREAALWGRFWRRHAVLEWESITQDAREGRFHLFRVDGKAGGKYSGILPGIEGVMFLMQEDAKNGRIPSLMGRMASLRRAAGGYGMVDYIEWGFLNGMYSDERNYALLERAYSRGFSNFQSLSHLSFLASRTGMAGMADEWMKRALERNPEATRESVMRDLYGR